MRVKITVHGAVVVRREQIAALRYGEMIGICQKATAIDPYDEELHYWLILSLYKTGEQQQALQH